MLQISCPHCAQPLQIPEQYAGKVGQCKKCGGSFAVPALAKPVVPDFGASPLESAPATARRPTSAQVQSTQRNKRIASIAGIAVITALIVYGGVLLVRTKPFTWQKKNGEAVLTLPGGIAMEFVGIPAGSFLMGSSITPEESKKRYGPEITSWYLYDYSHPRHSVTLTKGYWLQKHEITNAQFGSFVKDTGYVTTGERQGGGQELTDKSLIANPQLSWKTPGWNIKPDQPVVFMSWEDAKAFCDWLAVGTGLQFNLPTEAQWEYAYRAGTTTEYFWGDEKASRDQYAWDGTMPPKPVGQKKANPWGLYDIDGNVVEWCRDNFEPWYYAVSPAVDPLGPVEGKNRCDRWQLAAYRLFDDATGRFKETGFRVCMEPERDITSACKFASPELPKDLPANPRVKWFREAQWGVMVHCIPFERIIKTSLSVESWNNAIENIDVQTLADQLASTGAGYCLFTVGMNSGYYCSPNATYDRIAGVRPSKCSKRDLVGDLADALNARGLRLIAFLFASGPNDDAPAAQALGWNDSDQRKRSFQNNWEQVIREWSMRWGTKVSGWWFDYCNEERFNHSDAPNVQSFIAAARTGNPDSIIALCSYVGSRPWTTLEDYVSGEAENPADVQYSGTWVDMQYHMLSYLGEKWGTSPPRFTASQVVTLTKNITDKGGVVTWDVPIEANGTISQPFLEQLQALGMALTKPAK